MVLVRVLFTGSRRWRDRDPIINALRMAVAAARTAHPNAVPSLVHGAHWEGGDAIADAYAVSVGFLYVEKVPARWRELGPKAGPIRNQEMVDLRPWLCVAFPIGEKWSGTRDCMAKATAAGIPVWVPAEGPLAPLPEP